jgi:pyridoxal phosphate enzyme (YggS family)
MIAANIQKIKQEIGSKVKLIAVTKTKPVSMIMEAYQTGHKIYGENRVQELVEKQKQLPQDVEWHLIGHLQTNKVKYIAPFVHTIHSVDSFKLLKTINKEAAKHNRVINCLLQGFIAQEETKYGLNFNELENLAKDYLAANFLNVNIVGLMGMATFTSNKEQIKQEFNTLKLWFDQLKTGIMANNSNFCELSMGMSGDYLIAVECGSTMVRIGSSIFGS